MLWCGFELYSRWVPLINQSIISTIKIFILNHRSKNSVVAIVIFIINRAFVPLLNDMASHTLPYAATSIRRTFLSKDTASLASQSAAFIFLRTLASELSTYHLASFIWQDQAVLLWQNTVKPLLNGTPPPPGTYRLVLSMERIPSKLGHDWWNETLTRGMNLKKLFGTIVLFAVRRWREVCSLRPVTAVENVSVQFVFWSLGPLS